MDNATLKTDDLALLTTKQAAERLSIGARKLWTLTNCGKIPHVRIGKCVRYRPGDLAAYVEAHTQTGRGRR
jgi:excisionase family DNA binding protein